MSALSERRDQKIKLYGKKLPGLGAYMDFFVPAITLISVWGVITEIRVWSGHPIAFIVQALYALVAFCTLVSIRDVDMTSFTFAVLLQIATLTKSFAEIVRAFIATWQVSGAVGSVAADVGGIPGAIIMSGAGVGTGLVMFAEIVAFILICCFAIYYLVVFIKHKEFFAKDIKDFKAELLK